MVYDMDYPQQRTAMDYMLYTRDGKPVNKIALEEYLSAEAHAAISVDVKGNDTGAPKEKMYTSIVDAIAQLTGEPVEVEDF